MLHYKLPHLEDSHILADQMKETYSCRKKSKGQSVNKNRLAYLDLLKLLRIRPSEGLTRRVIFEKSKIYAGDEIRSLATGDFVGSITGYERTDEDELYQERNQINELKAGILIFLEEDISRKEYKGRSSKRSKGYFYTSGSDLSKLIEETLCVDNENQLRDEERFIYLSDLYHYVKEKIGEEIHHPIWKTKQHLLSDICAALSQIRKRDEERIKLLAHGSPQLNMLIRCIEALPENYENTCGLRLFKNSHRENLISFVRFMNITLTKKMDDLGQEDEENEEVNARLDAIKKAILGIIVLGIMKISAEYKSPFFSPEGGLFTKGSDCYKEFKKILNVDDLNEISYDDRIDWLRTLSQQLSEAMKVEGLDKDLFKKLDYFLLKADLYVTQLQLEKKQPSLTARCISKGISVSAQYGIGCAVASQAMPLIGGVVAGALTGPVGVIVYGLAGTVIMTKLVDVVPGPISWAYGWVLEKIGSAIGDTTVNVAKFTFKMGKNGLKALLGHPNLKREDKEFMQRYIDALLRAPKDVVSDEIKSQLRLALGIEEDLSQSFELMKP